MEHRMVVSFRLDGDELFPVRFLEWLASAMESGDCGSDYPDEKVVIAKVEVGGRQVIPPVDR